MEGKYEKITEGLLKGFGRAFNQASHNADKRIKHAEECKKVLDDKDIGPYFDNLFTNKQKNKVKENLESFIVKQNNNKKQCDSNANTIEDFLKNKNRNR